MFSRKNSDNKVIFLLFSYSDKYTIKVCEFPVNSLSKKEMRTLSEEVNFYNNHIKNLLQGMASQEFYNDIIDKDTLYEIYCGRGHDFVTEEQLYDDKYYVSNDVSFFLYEGYCDRREDCNGDSDGITDVTQEIALSIFVDKLFQNTLFSMGGLFPLEMTLRGIQLKNC